MTEDGAVTRGQRDAARLIMDREMIAAKRDGREPVISEHVRRTAVAPLKTDWWLVSER